MKYKRIKMWVFTLLLIILPVKVNAAGFGITPSATQVKPGDTVTFNIWTDTAFSTSTFTISYDVNVWDYVSSGPNQGSEVPNVQPGNISSVLSNVSGTISGTFYQVTLKAKASSGSSIVSIASSDTWDAAGTGAIAMANGSVSITHFTPSSNANLKNLSVGTCPITFNPEVLVYDCPEVESASVMITAIAADDNALIRGHGNINLNYGDNALAVVVTAQDGSVKTYTINIKRKDTRSAESKLSSLTVSKGKLDFNPDTYEYTVNVDNNVESITLEAKAKNETSTITGTGKKSLSVGANKYEIKVVAENGAEAIYTVTVYRAPDENTSLTKLKSLGYNKISLNPDKFVHSIGVYNDVTTLEFKYETLSPTAKVEIKGNENFAVGINVVTITVTDGNSDPTLYRVLVYKEGEAENLYTSDDAEVSISQRMLANANFKYAVLNAYDGLRFMLVFASDTVKSGDDYYVINSNNDPYSIFTNVPKGTKIEYIVEDITMDGKTYYLYAFDAKNNKYVILDNKLKIENNVLTFTSEGYQQYLLLDEKIASEDNTPEISKTDRVANKLIGFALGIAFSALLVMGYLIVKKRLNYKK